MSSCSDSFPGIDDKGRRIYYVQANSKEDAIRILADQRATVLRKLRENHQIRKTHRRAHGICTHCTREARPGRRTCVSCGVRDCEIVKRKTDKIRALGLCVICESPRDGKSRNHCAYCSKREVIRVQIRRGAPLDLPPARKKPAKSEITLDEAARLRLAQIESLARSQKGNPTSLVMKRKCYRACLEAFDTMPPARFRGWLVAQIQEQQDKIDAKRKAAGLPPQAVKAEESNTARVIAAALGQVRKHSTARVDKGARRSA